MTELDALWWAPGWTPVDLGTFHERVTAVVEGPAWIVEGYYVDEAAVPLVWPRAEVVVWLDLPRRLCQRRALRRSAWSVVRRTDLWGTNRQPASALSPASVVRFVRRWPTYPARIERAIAADPTVARKLVRLRTDAEVRAWLAGASGAPRTGRRRRRR